MQAFHYQNQILYCEDVALSHIASTYGTPCYVYSRAAIESQWRAFDNAFAGYPHRICYAVKANSNIAILNILAKLNSGFDIVSIGELERVLAAGGDPNKIVFSGVGKQTAEINRALDVGIFCFNIESECELERLNELAKLRNKIANISLRVNPNIDARTHPYIATGLHENKFGIEMTNILPLTHKIKSLTHVNMIGIGCHIGSQLTELDPFLEAVDCMLLLAKQIMAEGIALKNLNLGGGLGVHYRNETPPKISEYVIALRDKVANAKLEIILEPGRIITASAGVLLTKVEYIKTTPYKNFAIIDAAMNDFMRPALYNAWQNIIPVQVKPNLPAISYDIVGPVCESSDFLGKERELSLETQDLLAICNAGAYGFSMSSNYNSRPRVAEVMVEGKQTHLIRKRELIADLYSLEALI